MSSHMAERKRAHCERCRRKMRHSGVDAGGPWTMDGVLDATLRRKVYPSEIDEDACDVCEDDIIEACLQHEASTATEATS